MNLNEKDLGNTLLYGSQTNASINALMKKFLNL